MQFKPALVTAALATLVLATPAPRDVATCPSGSTFQCCRAALIYGNLQIAFACAPGALPCPFPQNPVCCNSGVIGPSLFEICISATITTEPPIWTMSSCTDRLGLGSVSDPNDVAGSGSWILLKVLGSSCCVPFFSGYFFFFNECWNSQYSLSFYASWDCL